MLFAVCFEPANVIAKTAWCFKQLLLRPSLRFLLTFAPMVGAHRQKESQFRLV